MSESKINLKRSEILRIEAAIVEKLENNNIEFDDNRNLWSEKEDGTCVISFPREKISLEELNKVKQDLDGLFELFVSARNQKSFLVNLETRMENLIQLIEKQ